MSDVERAFKSTLDKLVGDLAEKITADPAHPVRFFDLDDSATARDAQSGTEHAIVYQYTNMSGRPPLFSVDFLVGAKTTNDEGNYALQDILTEVRGLFFPMARFDLYRYDDKEEGFIPSEADWKGVLTVTEVDTGPLMASDKQAGIRLLAVSGKVCAP